MALLEGLSKLGLPPSMGAAITRIPVFLGLGTNVQGKVLALSPK